MRSNWVTSFILSVAFAGHSLAAKPEENGNSAATRATILGQRVADFSLQDARGKSHSLSELSDKPVVVIAFLGTECPLAKLYAPRLAAMAKDYESKGVAFLALDSNVQDSVTEILHFERTHKVNFPILKDLGNVVADQWGAERTPEVFVLDKDRVVRYRGRIDDQFGFDALGRAYQRSEPTKQELTGAIDALLSSKPVAEPETKVAGCLIGRVRKPNPKSEVTFTKDIAPILNQHCVACHRPGQIGPFTLTSYSEAAGWAEMIKEVVSERRMPPWHADPKFGHFVNDARLPEKDVALITRWVDNGAPEGDPKQLPPSPSFPDGWMIPQPDQVIYMSDKPYTVPAKGTVEYQRFVVDPGWTEDKWIKAIEPRPGNLAVVHHIIVYVRPPSGPKTGPAGRLQADWLGAFAPGLRQEVLPDELARYVPAGSKFIIELHYTPNGTEQEDLSYVGFKFADPKKVKKELVVKNAGNFTFKIPPHAKDYQVESKYKFNADSMLHSLSPHMHLRGKSFRYDAVYPDGKTQTLLWVPKYDFGWQTTYQLKEPVFMPKGSSLHCVAWFDNSEDNLANPDPSSEVTWGEQTWEEMMFGWFEMMLADQDLTKPQPPPVSRVKEFLARVDVDGTQIDQQLRDMARESLKDPQKFELMAYYLRNSVPQVDRVCVSYVDKGKLRLRNVQEVNGMKTFFRTTSTRINAAGEELADAATSPRPLVFSDYTNAKGILFKKLAGNGMKSSVHIPVEIDGKPMSVNFWSTDADAFPPSAVEILSEVTRWMTSGK
ncbi:MAG: redoxin domain-containing protein [Planctomycetota bacterium]